MSRPWIAALVGVAAAGTGIGVLVARRERLPLEELRGSLVFVSDQDGHDELYVRYLPDGEDVRLTYLTEPAVDPKLSPDGRRVAFSVGGRIGVASLVTREVGMLTLGVDWSDGQPSWRPDASGFAVASRRGRGERAEIHLLELGPDGGILRRRPLTRTPGIDESEPTFTPDGSSVVFVRQGGLHLLELASGLTRRLTTGLRESYAPRFLPTGELACLWSEEKQFGLDVIDLATGERRTLSQGTVEYRSLAPSPDGRFLATTYSLDLSFRFREILKPRPTREIHLLDGAGRSLGALARAWRFSNHSPDWGGWVGVESTHYPLL